jgi:hypothetical protein
MGGRTTVLLLRKNDTKTYHSGSKTFAIPLVTSPRSCNSECTAVGLLHRHTRGDPAKPSRAGFSVRFRAIGAEPLQPQCDESQQRPVPNRVQRFRAVWAEDSGHIVRTCT